MAYRLPREPSTPRIRVWRALKRLGVAQLGDGLVALPADARTREQLDWLADAVVEAGGDATVWLGAPASRRQERELSERMRAAVAAEYTALTASARTALDDEPAAQRRALARLRRAMRTLRRRDYFPPGEREAAQAALAELAAACERVGA